MSEDKKIANVCVFCGANFHTRIKREHCPICKAAKDRIEAWLVGQSEMPPDDDLQTLFQAFRKAALMDANKNDGATKTPRYEPKSLNLTGQCKFCGRTTKSAAYEYCMSCIRDGFANVHKLTGRTNGWDKKHRTGKRFDRRRGIV